LIDMGKKLFMHAVDVERAWNQTEALGLRAKLLGFDMAHQENSLAWWMSKEPLRTKPVGQGTGRTAAEIAKARGLDRLIVAHETRSFLALESIERSHKGSPNFFISRNGPTAESAAYGEGTYTRIGRKGAVGSGLTVRMAVDPGAREGTDFFLGGSGDYVVLKNKAAAVVLNESYSLTPAQYVEMIAHDQDFDANEKGLIEKMTRRLSHQAKNLSPEQMALIKTIYSNSDRKIRILSELVRLDFPLPISDSEYDRILQQLTDRVVREKREYRELLLSNVNSHVIEKRALALSADLASIAKTFEQMEVAIGRGYTPHKRQGSIAGPYTGAIRKLAAANFERAWTLAERDGKLIELRALLEGTNLTGVYKDRMLPRITTAEQLLWLKAKLGEEVGSVGHVGSWIIEHPVEVMKLKPTLENLAELYKVVGASARAKWAKAALPYIKSPAGILLLLDAGFPWRGGIPLEVEEIGRLWNEQAPRFLAMKPTPEELEEAKRSFMEESARDLIRKAWLAVEEKPPADRAFMERAKADMAAIRAMSCEAVF
ncbi:MAG: hypothetical protein AAB250_19840, partial [Bdellovibrionota bacterium]